MANLLWRSASTPPTMVASNWTVRETAPIIPARAGEPVTERAMSGIANVANAVESPVAVSLVSQVR